MAISVSIIVPASEPGAPLLETLDGALRQSGSPVEVVLAAGGWDDPLAAGALAGLAARPGLTVVACPAGTRAALCNAGARAAGGAALVFVRPGDRLEPGFAAATSSVLAADSALGAVATWTAEEWFAGRTRVRKLPALDLEAALGPPGVLPASVLVRKSAWDDLVGFDPELPALEQLDFWLRFFSAGGRAAVVPEPLVVERRGSGSAWRTELDPKRHGEAAARLLERHRPLFERRVATLFDARRAVSREMEAIHTPLAERHRAGLAELETLREEIGQLRSHLQAIGEDAVDLGDLRRTTPIDRNWGMERGEPLDRYYIDAFLAEHAADIRGTVLEVQEPDLTLRHGGEQVTHVDVVDVNADNPRATLLADLRHAAHVPDESYDCFILTQTLHVIDDMPRVLAEARRLLKPGGVLLATLPSASRVCLEYGPAGDLWRVTEAGARRMFADAFPGDQVEVRGYGNVLATTAFLEGLSRDEIPPAELDAYDPWNPTLVGVRAVKSPTPEARRDRGTRGDRGVILLYHRVGTGGPDPHALAVPPELFDAHLQALVSRYRPLPLGELLARSRERSLPEGAVAVTLDDGYVDNLEHASPLLVRHGVPATFYVVSGKLEAPAEFWWDALARALLSPGDFPATLEVELGGERLTAATATAEQRREAHDRIHGRLVGAAQPERDRAVEGIVAWSGRSLPAGAPRPMGSDAVRELARRAGHAVGAHGVHHLALPALDDRARRAEALESRRALERLLGTDVRDFSYPYGSISALAAGSVRGAGYATAVTCRSAAVSAGDDPLLLPRVEVRPSVSDLDLLLRPFFDQPAGD